MVSGKALSFLILPINLFGLHVQLKKAVGDEVRVALREGAVEYHCAHIVGRKDDSFEVVYQDLPGLRNFIDRRSRRLWHGTLDEDGWEVCPSLSHTSLAWSSFPDKTQLAFTTLVQKICVT